MKPETGELQGKDLARSATILSQAGGPAKSTPPACYDSRGSFEDILKDEPDPIDLLRSDREPGLLEVIEVTRDSAAAGAGS